MGTVFMSTETGKTEWDKKQVKAMRMIGTTVPPKILKQINTMTTGPEMWEALCDLYEGRRNKTMKAHTIRCLTNDLKNMRFKLGDDINVHLGEMYCKRVELADLQYTVQDIDMVEYMLKGLPQHPEFDTLRGAIRYGTDFMIKSMI